MQLQRTVSLLAVVFGTLAYGCCFFSCFFHLDKIFLWYGLHLLVWLFVISTFVDIIFVLALFIVYLELRLVRTIAPHLDTLEFNVITVMKCYNWKRIYARWMWLDVVSGKRTVVSTLSTHRIPFIEYAYQVECVYVCCCYFHFYWTKL